MPVIRWIVEHAADIMRQRHEKGTTHVDVQKLYPWIVVKGFALSNKNMRIGQRALYALFHRLNCERISQQPFSYSTQVDITSMALFGHTQDLTAKDENDIYPDFLTSIDMFTNHMWLTKHFSILNRIALSLPPSFAEKVAPGYASFGSVRRRSVGSKQQNRANAQLAMRRVDP